MLVSLVGYLVAVDFVVFGGVRLLGTTLGDGPLLEIGDTWIWILTGTGFWISMSAGTGLLMDFLVW